MISLESIISSYYKYKEKKVINVQNMKKKSKDFVTVTLKKLSYLLNSSRNVNKFQ